MTERRSVFAKPLTTLATVALALVATLSTANAGERRVAVGEVRSAVAHRSVDAAFVRTAVESEVAKIDPARIQGKRRAVLSVALLEMGTQKGPKGPVDTCRVVATVRDAARGALLATLETQTRSPHGTPSVQADRAMVQSAVQGIMLRVPEALK
jgi:hypothetical protein